VAQPSSDVIVMGCAGMAAHQAALQDALGIPVVEPSQAAVAMAMGQVQLDWHRASDVGIGESLSMTTEGSPAPGTR
jgi:Asp/Glu/hydantoin racemase